MLSEKRSMTSFLIGVLKTDEDELLSVSQSVGEFLDCFLRLRSVGEM